MASTSIQRLHADTRKTGEKVRARIEVCLQSVVYPKSRIINKWNKTSAFVRTMSKLYDLVLGDFDRTSTRAVFHIERSYSCDEVGVSSSGTALTFDVRCPAKCLVSLQWDQSSGQLAKDMRRHLVTDTVLAQLRAEALYLGVEVYNYSEGTEYGGGYQQKQYNK